MYKVVVKNTGLSQNIRIVADVEMAESLEKTCDELQKLYVNQESPQTSIEVFDGQRSVAVLDPGAANWVIRDSAEKIVDPDRLTLVNEMQPIGSGAMTEPDQAEAFQSGGLAAYQPSKNPGEPSTFDPVAALDEMGVLAFAPGQRRKEPPMEKVNVSEIFMESTARGILSSDQKRPRPDSDRPSRWSWYDQPMEFVSPVPEPPLEQRPMKLGKRLLGGRKPQKFNFGEA